MTRLNRYDSAMRNLGLIQGEDLAFAYDANVLMVASVIDAQRSGDDGLTGLLDDHGRILSELGDRGHAPEDYEAKRQFRAACHAEGTGAVP